MHVGIAHICSSSKQPCRHVGTTGKRSENKNEWNKGKLQHLFLVFFLVPSEYSIAISITYKSRAAQKTPKKKRKRWLMHSKLLFLSGREKDAGNGNLILLFVSSNREPCSVVDVVAIVFVRIPGSAEFGSDTLMLIWERFPFGEGASSDDLQIWNREKHETRRMRKHFFFSCGLKSGFFFRQMVD